MLQLATYSVDIGLAVGKQRRRVEVAIGASALAERNVYVDTGHLKYWHALRNHAIPTLGGDDPRLSVWAG